MIQKALKNVKNTKNKTFLERNMETDFARLLLQMLVVGLLT